MKKLINKYLLGKLTKIHNSDETGFSKKNTIKRKLLFPLINLSAEKNTRFEDPYSDFD